MMGAQIFNFGQKFHPTNEDLKLQIMFFWKKIFRQEENLPAG